MTDADKLTEVVESIRSDVREREVRMVFERRSIVETSGAHLFPLPDMNAVIVVYWAESSSDIMSLWLRASSRALDGAR